MTMTKEAKEILREEARAWRELSSNCERELTEISYTPYTYSENPEEQELFSTAVKIARTVLKNGVMREGSTRQWTLYRDACKNCAIADYDPDVQDCISEAYTALLQATPEALNNRYCEIAEKILLNLHDVVNAKKLLGEKFGEEEKAEFWKSQAFREGCRAINNYLYSLRAIKLNATAQRTVYLDDLLNEGDIVNVNNEISNLVAEISIQENLRPVEREVLKLWVEGYSVAQTGEKLHLKVKYELVDGKMKATCRAVETHRANIKRAVEKLYPDYAKKVNK